MRHPYFLTVLAGLSLAGAAAAQEIPITSAGAGGRFQTQLDPKTAVPGFRFEQVTAFRSELKEVTDRLTTMEVINTPQAPLCMRVSSYVEIAPERDLLEASIDVHRPVVIDGRCSKLTGSTIQFWLNRTDNLFLKRLRRAPKGSDKNWYVLPIKAIDDHHITLEDDGEEIEVFTHGRAPLLRRVTMGSYLGSTPPGQSAGANGTKSASFEQWRRDEFPAVEREMRRAMQETLAQVQDPAMKRESLAMLEATITAHVDAMKGNFERQGELRAATPAAGQSPSESSTFACEIGYRIVASNDCPLAGRLVELNPDYFDLSQPAKVQLLLIRTGKTAEHGESGDAFSGRRAIWRALDRRKMAEMLR